MKTIIMATNWGFTGSMDEFCAKAKKDGYDGIEVWWSDNPKTQKELFDAVQKHDLKLGYLTSGNDTAFEKHLASFKINLKNAISSHPVMPLYVNCHSGKDYYTSQENHQIIEFTLQMARETEIEIMHETHRGRMCYSAPITRSFLEKYPEMGLTLDISHWTNVHESLLEDQPETVELALSRSRHIHLRVGYQEGPQVNDPRAPEWKSTLGQHLKWWDKVVEYRRKAGAKYVTFLTEFGPPNYLPTLPYTKQPVADQWAINVFMKNLIKERYS